MAAAGKRARYAFTAARQAGQAARQGYGRRQAIRTAGRRQSIAAGMAGKRQGSTAAAGQAVEGRRQAKTAARQA